MITSALARRPAASAPSRWRSSADSDNNEAAAGARADLDRTALLEGRGRVVDPETVLVKDELRRCACRKVVAERGRRGYGIMAAGPQPAGAGRGFDLPAELGPYASPARLR